MSVLFYRRPDYINPPSQPLNSNACARYVEKTKGSNRAIPEGLSFEEVIANKALPVGDTRMPSMSWFNS
jgi:hypothetical protein